MLLDYRENKLHCCNIPVNCCEFTWLLQHYVKLLWFSCILVLKYSCILLWIYLLASNSLWNYNNDSYRAQKRWWWEQQEWSDSNNDLEDAIKLSGSYTLIFLQTWPVWTHRPNNLQTAAPVLQSHLKVFVSLLKRQIFLLTLFFSYHSTTAETVLAGLHSGGGGR